MKFYRLENGDIILIEVDGYPLQTLTPEKFLEDLHYDLCNMSLPHDYQEIEWYKEIEQFAIISKILVDHCDYKFKEGFIGSKYI